MSDLQIRSKPSRGRAAQREETRSAILSAATDLFAMHGYEGTAMPSVAAQAGVRSSLIFYHFATKLDLWKACVDEVFANVRAFIGEREEALGAQEGIAYFRSAVAIHIGAAAAVPAYHRILFREGMHDSERLRWLIETHQREMSDRIVAVVERAQDEGVLPRTLDPMHLKFLTSGMFTLPITLAPEYRILTGDDPLDPAFVDRHIEACLSILMPPGSHA